jgi:hypothetical protein
MATSRPVTLCHGCHLSDSLPKFMCMAKCEYVCHATCILQLSDSVAEDQSTQLCNGCDAQWLPAMAQFLEPVAEYEKECGFELDEDGAPQNPAKRARKAPKMFDNSPKKAKKAGGAQGPPKQQPQKAKEKGKKGEPDAQGSEVWFDCPAGCGWEGTNHKGNFNKHMARNHTPASERPRNFPGPKEGEEGYVKGCYWCELGFLLNVHLNNHLQRPNSHCEWVPVELPAAPEADAESPGSD